MENNTVKITGKIMETPEYLLTSPDRRKIYKSTIEVMRTSGNMDVIPIQVPEQIVQEIRDNVGGRITIFGEYRSYNEKDGEIGTDLVCGSGQQKTGQGTGSAGDKEKTGNESNENFKAAL